MGTSSGGHRNVNHKNGGFNGDILLRNGVPFPRKDAGARETCKNLCAILSLHSFPSHTIRL